MKNFCFPSHLSRVNGRFSKLTQIRATLVFALVTLFSCLPFYALAQNDAPRIKAKESGTYTTWTEGGSAFVVYQGPNGDTICRDATPDEASALRSGASDYGLHQINHLNKIQASNTTSATQTVESATGLTIVLRATQQLEGNPEAKAAFIAAAAKWEALIKDPITINVDVDFGTTFFGTPFSGSDVIGATQTREFYSTGNYPDVRQRLINRATGSESQIANALPAGSVPTDLGSVNTVLIASPLLRALGYGGPPDDTDGRIAFNSSFGFDFDPSDGITGNRTDFDAVAVHEMGHLLGFNSEVGDRELNPSAPLLLSIWDLFRFRPAAANLNNFSTAQRILSSGGEQVQFNGGPELRLSTGRPDGNGGDGNQASHWKADEQNGGIFIGIMDPTISRNRRETMTANDQSAIDSLGYLITAGTPPANDDFANAQIVSGNSGTVNGSNVFATKETGEPTHSPDGVASGRSIWYRWTAPNSGLATITTAGSNYDTLLAVYTGSSVSGLTLVLNGNNDDADHANGVLTSAVQINVVGGTIYQIAVDGYGGDQGSVVLNWSLAGGPTPTPTPTPGPNTVQFTASTASATETAHATTNVDLLVTRTGDTAQAATVNYATSDGTASERSDYLAALGTLRFAAGETSKSIPVFIVDDSYGESAETFNIALSSPVGCTLGSPAAVAVTIISDEIANGPNPVKDASFDSDFFVREHYTDFFNRAPDPSGLAFWKGQIDECETRPLAEQQPCREIRRINVSAAFFLSIEFQQTGYLVERLYKAAYGDATGTSNFGPTHQLSVPIIRLNEFLPDTQQIGKGVVIGQPGADQLLENNKQTLIAEFVQRSRFTTAYPISMSPGQFVDTLNAKAGGPLSQGERDQLVSDLTSGAKTRAQVLRAIAEDPDLFAAESNRAFVLAQYFGYLRRNPNDAPDSDYSGYDFWLTKLNQFGGNFVNAEMVKAFILSGEYQGRFGP